MKSELDAIYMLALNKDEELARDMFAAVALTAILIKGYDRGRPEEIAYECAELMIAERRKRQETRLREAIERSNKLCEELQNMGGIIDEK